MIPGCMTRIFPLDGNTQYRSGMTFMDVLLVPCPKTNLYQNHCFLTDRYWDSTRAFGGDGSSPRGDPNFVEFEKNPGVHRKKA